MGFTRLSNTVIFIVLATIGFSVDWQTLLRDWGERDPSLSEANRMASMNMTELVQFSGYPLEEHRVTTKDGYILGLFRIPHGRLGRDVEDQGERSPVLLSASLFSSSTSYCLGSHETSQSKPLAFRLADEGYDVWLSNIRGTSYSLRHAELEAESPEFWDFSLHETGALDHTAEIDYILDRTRRDSLFYIGYSRGSTEALIMLSDQPEYNAKIRAAFLVSPVALEVICDEKECSHHNSSSANEQKRLIAEQGRFKTSYKDLTTFRTAAEFVDKFCQIGWTLTNYMCFPLIRKLFSLHQEEANKVNIDMLPAYLSHLREETSLDSVIHFYQQIDFKDKFTRFDHGSEKNLAHYGQPVAPSYDLGLISAPVAILVGDSDGKSNVQGAKKLQERMANVFNVTCYENWTHASFYFPQLAHDKAYADILKMMAQF